jgi:hypothetical protein
VRVGEQPGPAVAVMAVIGYKRQVVFQIVGLAEKLLVFVAWTVSFRSRATMSSPLGTVTTIDKGLETSPLPLTLMNSWQSLSQAVIAPLECLVSKFSAHLPPLRC